MTLGPTNPVAEDETGPPPRSELVRAGHVVKALPVRLLLGILWTYQHWISPGLAPRCRFTPSCSSFAVEALRGHGAARGTLMSAKRLLRCHPWNPGGPDPVPPPRTSRGPGSAAMTAATPSTLPGA